MSELDVYDAIDVCARQAIRLAFEAWAEDGWESLFPDLSLDDFDWITEHAMTLLPDDVDMDTFREAYDLLADRWLRAVEDTND